jgi:hypothetical protein
VTAPTIQPGTRCECRDHGCSSDTDHGDGTRCDRYAMRIVRVKPPAENADVDTYLHQLALCEECAEFHGDEEGAR